MNYLKSVQKSLAFIEDHLEDDIDIHDLAKTSGYSPYHFQKIFNHVTGDSVKSYVKKRRITEAAKLLSESKKSVIDVAMQFRYGSREAFSRAFKQVYGLSPKDAKQLDVHYVVRDILLPDRLEFEYYRRLYGMQPIIRYFSRRYFVGKIYSAEHGPDLQEIPLIWVKWQHHNYWEDIYFSGGDDELIGMFLSSHLQTYDYFIGREVPSKRYYSSHLDCIELPPMWFADFHMGEASVEIAQKAWRYVFDYWYPSSEYKLAAPITMERIKERFVPHQKSKGFFMEISIPIRQKDEN